MMEFIMLTLSITVAILLASVIGVVIMTRPAVMKLYMDWAMKTANDVCEKALASLGDGES